jgi:hypothetical protein
MKLDLLGLVLQLASGLVGGNLAGALFRSINMGFLGNSLAGIIGGGIGSQMVTSSLGQAAAMAAATPDPGAILAQAAGGGIGGTVLMALVGVLNRIGRPR